MATYDVSEYLEDGAIVLEGIRSTEHPKGRSYRFESPSFEVGLWLKNLIEFGQRASLRAAIGVAPKPDEFAELILDDNEEIDTYRRVMGDTFDELRADDVPWQSVQGIFTLLLKKWGNSQPIEVTLNEGKAAAPNRETRRAAAKAAPATGANSSSRKAGSKSSRARTPRKKAPASSATRARTTGQGSTRSSRTSAAGKDAAKTA